MLKLIIISGRSGSGKSTALHVLEDMGYYCIDNLPASLLVPLMQRLAEDNPSAQVSVSIDARNLSGDLAQFNKLIEGMPKNIDREVVFLDSASPTLVKRFSETRRKHPLSNLETDLGEALRLESRLLEPISAMADLTIDTTYLTIHELRDLIRSRVARDSHNFALLFVSFAYKNGVPVDADLVFDVRCLPNPHWKPELRALTGLDNPVQDFLDSEQEFEQMAGDIRTFLDTWLPRFEANNRSYMTIAIGCTGGQHRSVYMAELLFRHFSNQWQNAQIRHREMR